MTCMCHDDGPLTFETILSDPLIHMVMASDGVSMTELIEVLDLARGALAERQLLAATAAIASSARLTALHR